MKIIQYASTLGLLTYKLTHSSVRSCIPFQPCPWVPGFLKFFVRAEGWAYEKCTVVIFPLYEHMKIGKGL